MIRDLALLDLHQYKSGAQILLSNGVVWCVMEAMVIYTSLEILRVESESLISNHAGAVSYEHSKRQIHIGLASPDQFSYTEATC